MRTNWHGNLSALDPARLLNTEADELSKRVAKTWTLRKSANQALSANVGCKLTLPPYNTIRSCIKKAVAEGGQSAFVIPKWRSQTWWHFLESNFKLINLEKALFIAIPDVGLPPWDMILAHRS